MSKYIIDTGDYLFTTDGVLVVGFDCDNKPATFYNSLDNLEELNSDYINEHYGSLQDEAYQKGINDGSLDVKLRAEGAYQRGLDDAWEAARRIVVDTDHGGLALGTLSEIFGTQSYSYIMRENNAQEAIAKIKAYDDKHSDRIEVGDEVKALRGKAVVTAVKDDLVHYFYSGGDYGCIELYHVTKTGKHYDIASILEAMRT